MYRHLLVQFHPFSPSSSAPEGPTVARLRSLGENLVPVGPSVLCPCVKVHAL